MDIHRHDLCKSRTSKRKIEIEVQKLIDVRGKNQRKRARDSFVPVEDYYSRSKEENGRE